MIAYLDLPSGLSGDMLLGCLVDCGWSIERLRHTIESLSLPAEEWAVLVETVVKSSLRATRVDVLVEEGTHQRRLADIVGIISESSLPKPICQRAIAVFNRLADAEARVHGTTREQVHFHEVGAMDAIVDIVGSIAGLHDLGIDKLYASPIPLGPGWTPSAHGRLPLPAPATLELLSAVGAPTRPAPGPGELVTPTAAALLAELATFEQPAITLSRIGIGAGQRDFDWPNIARMWLGEGEASHPLVQLETNIDDMNPQLYSAVSDHLFAAGALDVWLTPVQMKKGRPGVVLSVLGNTEDEQRLADILLRHTTTLGVRVQRMAHRHIARREIREVTTPFGELRVKVKWICDEAVGAFPEYEDCREAAERTGATVMTVHQSAVVAGLTLLADLRRASGGNSSDRTRVTVGDSGLSPSPGTPGEGWGGGSSTAEAAAI
jgi:uncharacterized protein (TIGR00299 family) protein